MWKFIRNKKIQGLLLGTFTFGGLLAPAALRSINIETLIQEEEVMFVSKVFFRDKDNYGLIRSTLGGVTTLTCVDEDYDKILDYCNSQHLARFPFNYRFSEIPENVQNDFKEMIKEYDSSISSS